jgi:hypothetical protein
MNTEPDDAEAFIRPRTVAGILMFGLIAALALMDSVRPDYTLDTVTLGLLSGTGTVLLGVEPLKRLIK